MQYRPRQSPGPVVRCSNCQLAYVSRIADDHAIIRLGPVVGENDTQLLESSRIEDIAGSWEIPLLQAKERQRNELRLNALEALDRIEQFVQPPGRLLDFGCGGGFFLETAKGRGWTVTGLEPLAGHAVFARAKFGVTILCDTLRGDTFPPSSFDVVTSFQVFEHLPDPANELAKLHGILRPKGILLMEVPNIETWSVRLLGARHRHFVQDHLNFFSSWTLLRFLQANGFRVVLTYFPTRHITLENLVCVWLARYLPGPAPDTIARVLQTLRLAKRVVSLNLGDIVAVLALKIP